MSKSIVIRALFQTGVRRSSLTFGDSIVKFYTGGIAFWVLYSALFSRLDFLATSVIFLCVMLLPSFLYIGAFADSNQQQPSKNMQAFIDLSQPGLATVYHHLLAKTQPLAENNRQRENFWTTV